MNIPVRSDFVSETTVSEVFPGLWIDSHVQPVSLIAELDYCFIDCDTIKVLPKSELPVGLLHRP